jgi:hypothetical protein
MDSVATKRLLRWSAAPAIAVLLVWWLVRCSPTPREPSDGQGVGAAGPAGGVASFGISGRTTSPLVPGASVRVNLELSNARGTALSISGLTMSISTVSAPRSDPAHPCTPRDFAVRQVPADLLIVIPALAASTLRTLSVATGDWPRVSMLNTSVNQDGCQGASVHLDYRGTATQARP